EDSRFSGVLAHARGVTMVVRAWINIPVIVILMLAMPNLGLAQRTTATFGGIVQDSSGAVLPGASAELINEGTAAALESLTDERGEFLFDFVSAGTYTLKIGLSGFRTYEIRSITLGAARHVRRTYARAVGG